MSQKYEVILREAIEKEITWAVNRNGDEKIGCTVAFNCKRHVVKEVRISGISLKRAGQFLCKTEALRRYADALNASEKRKEGVCVETIA